MKKEIMPYLVLGIGVSLFVYLDKSIPILQTIKETIAENLLLVLIGGIILIVYLKKNGKI